MKSTAHNIDQQFRWHAGWVAGGLLWFFVLSGCTRDNTGITPVSQGATEQNATGFTEPRYHCIEEFQRSESCLVTIGTVPIAIRYDGLITGPDNKKLQLPLPKHFSFESTLATTPELIGNSALLVLEITDGDGGATFLALVNPDDLALKWTAEVPAFSPSLPLVFGTALYIGGIGTVAKIDTSGGRALWIVRDLYENETQAFTSFVKPRKEGNIIVFTENKASAAKYPGVREVRVDDFTGRLLSK